MRATPYTSISEPCDEPGIGSPVQKSTPQSTTLGQRLSSGAPLKCNEHVHRLGEVTFTCEDCGQSTTRPAKYGKHGQLLGHHPRFCLSCLKAHDRDHRRGKYNQSPRLNLWSPERKETAAHLWRNGHSATEIAVHLGSVTRNAVIGLVYRMGLMGTRPKAHKSQEQKFRRKAESQRKRRAKIAI